MAFYLVTGSDDSSDEGEEEELAIPSLPRRFKILMDTSLEEGTDDDAPAGDEASAAHDASDKQSPPMTADQSRNLYRFDWKAFPTVPLCPGMRRECFTNSNVGPTTPLADPYDIFTAIWDKQIMEYIASETNRYAQQLADQLSQQNGPHALSEWRDTTADELYVFFGLILATGMVLKPRVEDYWSTEVDIFYTPGFSANMSLSRFLTLSKCLHFANNEDMEALDLSVPEARLFKITPLLTHLNMKFQSLYNLSQNLALDQSLLFWDSRVEGSRRTKAAAVRINTYEVCEAKSGYLWRFELQTHKRSPPPPPEDPLSASTPATVLRLLHGLEYKGHTLWMDKYYNSPVLARELKSLGFDCAGTLRTNRQFVPESLHKLAKEDMGRGQLSGLTAGDVDVAVWCDSNRIAMISTFHGNAVALDRGGSIKPILILEYSFMMSGVDRGDQMLSAYPTERNQTKVWYKKLFRRLLNVSILNSYILHRQSHPTPSSHRNFRIALIKSLLSRHSTLSPTTTAATAPVELAHRLEEYGLGPDGSRLRRCCTLCTKRTQTYCFSCKQTVCRGSCFVNLHN